MTLGQRIQELRKGQNLSQEGLGERLGVSRQAVSRWEMDGAVPEVDKLLAMGKLFGVSLNELLQAGEEPTEESAGEAEPGQEPGGESQKTARSRWGRALPILSLAALILGLTALCVTFGRMTGRLQDRIVLLEGRVSALEEQAAAQQLTAPMVADFDCVPDLWEDESHVTYSFILTAARRTREMTVTIQALDAGKQTHQTQLDWVEGSIYAGELTLEGKWGRDVTLSALFQDGEANYTQPLVNISGVKASSWYSNVLWDGQK